MFSLFSAGSFSSVPKNPPVLQRQAVSAPAGAAAAAPVKDTATVSRTLSASNLKSKSDLVAPLVVPQPSLITNPLFSDSSSASHQFSKIDSIQSRLISMSLEVRSPLVSATPNSQSPQPSASVSARSSFAPSQSFLHPSSSLSSPALQPPVSPVASPSTPSALSSSRSSSPSPTSFGEDDDGEDAPKFSEYTLSLYEAELNSAYKLALGALEGEGSGWMYADRREGVDVFVKPQPKKYSHKSHVKVVGVVRGSPATVLFLFRDHKLRAIWDNAYESGSEVERIDRFTAVNAMKWKGAWPAKPKQLCTASRVVPYLDGSFLVYSTSVSHPSMNLTADHGKLLYSAFLVQPYGRNHSRVTLACHRNHGRFGWASASTAASHLLNHVLDMRLLVTDAVLMKLLQTRIQLQQEKDDLTYGLIQDAGYLDAQWEALKARNTHLSVLSSTPSPCVSPAPEAGSKLGNTVSFSSSTSSDSSNSTPTPMSPPTDSESEILAPKPRTTGRDSVSSVLSDDSLTSVPLLEPLNLTLPSASPTSSSSSTVSSQQPSPMRTAHSTPDLHPGSVGKSVSDLTDDSFESFLGVAASPSSPHRALAMSLSSPELSSLNAAFTILVSSPSSASASAARRLSSPVSSATADPYNMNHHRSGSVQWV